MATITLGIDLSKQLFSVCELDVSGRVVQRRGREVHAVAAQREERGPARGLHGAREFAVAAHGVANALGPARGAGGIGEVQAERALGQAGGEEVDDDVAAGELAPRQEGGDADGAAELHQRSGL